ncbi:guanine deaminase [Microbulbifer rhizosphaerae]|uniref:Guanine deaminase n=1 Tax=Microbulbifer rhizosphaerae TaxID=1562603 RepID=A0A7W4W907_9GAMM|nr:guanine deaminase [Microbulbifer rhizosphaerae]MBB3059881.1 guanine deaminase [Microbulbifer rhizosphaerae]
MKRGVRGTWFDFVDDPWKHVGREMEAARFHPDGLLVIEDGIIADFGPFDEVSPRHPDLEVTQIERRLILPGFIDGHIHVPQTRVLGAFGEQLLPWLETWVFPEEMKYADREYAEEGTQRFFDNLLAAGTTTCQAFTTSSPVSTEVFFEEASRRNMRVIGGLTGIDRMGPEEFLNTPEGFYEDSKALIERFHGQGRNLYAITPRFAYGASPELMEACRRLKQEFPDCWVNTHISENPSEFYGVLRLHTDCRDYLGVYEKYDLVGPRFSGGHGVWLSNDEFRRISAHDASLTFCPCSNLFLGSGLFRLGRVTDPAFRIRLSFGTDMGGGNRFSMLSVLDEAYKVGMCNNTLLDGSVDPSREDLAEAERNKLSPYRGFWSVTLGGAEGLYLDDKVGNFMLGKEADFVVLDWEGGPKAAAWHQSLVVGPEGPATMEQAANLLFGMMMVGDDRCVDETWIMGARAYKRTRA